MDLGIYSQVAWSLSHGAGFSSSIQGGSYLGDHLELLLLPLALIYRLLPSPLLLLLAQTLALGVGAYILMRFAEQRLPSRWAKGVGLAIILNPLLTNVALYEFHALAFIFPLVAWSAVLYVERKYRLWLISLVLTCFVREDMGVLLIGWSILALVDKRGWKWWGPPAVLGVGWFFLAQYIISSYRDGSYKYLVFYRRLGGSWGEILSSPFLHPIIFLRYFFRPDNFMITLGLLSSVGWLAILRPRFLLVGIFSFIQLLLIHSNPSSILRLHYIAPFLPLLTISAIIALQAIHRHEFRWVRAVLWRKDIVLVFSFVSILYLHGLIGVWSWPWNTSPEDRGIASLKREAITYIQPTDSVLSSFEFLPHLSNRRSLHSFNYFYLGKKQYSEDRFILPEDPDVIIFDATMWHEYRFLYKTSEVDGKTGEDRLRDLLDRGKYGKVYEVDSVVVYRRNGSAPQTSVTSTTSSASLSHTTWNADFRVSHNNGAVTFDQRWSVAQTSSELPVVEYTFFQHEKQIRKVTRVLRDGDIPLRSFSAKQAWNSVEHIYAPNATRAEIRLVKLDGNFRLWRMRTFRPLIRNRTVLAETSINL